MTTAGIIALVTPVLALLLRLLGKWIWRRVTGNGALEDELDENQRVIADGNQADINHVLDDRINGVRD